MLSEDELKEMVFDLGAARRGELNENIANNQATFTDGIRLVRNNLSALLRHRDEMMNTWIKK